MNDVKHERWGPFPAPHGLVFSQVPIYLSKKWNPLCSSPPGTGDTSCFARLLVDLVGSGRSPCSKGLHDSSL